ncbi:TPA: hypothetical protein EYN65_00855 [Candidatus Poribacteria bacterium]|nr:hypothetical protein [Candidatus Poribacteria bacterium]HIC01515.1 hypothetical protein [Candidatus Poribacteria bacterium]HIN30943.1 hypothetical protein [Candidatus Poribacteria bacterium]HIO82235.1 hypothetical protein [Candidatus Poribacteria bacterium]
MAQFLLTAKLTYTFGDQGSYMVELETLAGQEVVLVTDSMDLNEQATFLVSVTPEGTPAGNYTKKVFGQKMREKGSFWTLSLHGERWMPNRVAWNPMQQVWERTSVPNEPRRTFPIIPDEPLITLYPSHCGEWWLNASHWAGVYHHSNIGLFVGVLAFRPGNWLRPQENVPVLESDSEGKPYCVFPINGGARRWALYVEQAGNVVPLPADPDQEQLGKRYVRPPQIAQQ